MRTALAALACLFLAAHLPFLPSTPEDIDSVNFALGVKDFDVALHQPHPPGYPLFIGLSKVSTWVLGGATDQQAVVRGLSVWSAISGAVLVILLFGLFRALDGNEQRAWWAMGLTVACPLFWFTSLRPLSDMTGLAAAVVAQMLLVRVLAGPMDAPSAMKLLIVGAFVSGLAAGIRVQTAILTGPILLAAIVRPRARLSARARAGAVIAALVGVSTWAVPLVVISGGIEGYLTALGTQAGEDFSGVVMLWTNRTPRVAVDAFLHTFVWPWGSVVLGTGVCATAAVGALRLLLTSPRTLLLVAIAFVPYAIFHLLFHETVTVRYALPLVVPVSLLVVSSFAWAGRRATALSCAAVIASSLLMAAPAARAYGANDAPAFQALRTLSRPPRAAEQTTPVVGVHAVFRRPAEWLPPSGAVLRAPHGREWLALIERWRADAETSVAFVADPRRTDLALIDPRARELKATYRWQFPERPYVAGVRPGPADSYLLRPPGWMLDRGWALTAEIGGVTDRQGAGPHLQPSVAWVRARLEPALMMIGGRNLDASATSHLILSRGDHVIAEWDLSPGFFFRLVPFPSATLAGTGYLAMNVRAANTAGPVRVSLEQFDLQADGVEMAGFMDGWQEPEYNPTTARSWRWMSERAVVWVRPLPRDVMLTLLGESPLRYFDTAPVVRVSVAGREVARFAPASDFVQHVRLPASLLDKAAGQVLIESDRWFVPAERGGSADRRRLALRIYEMRVNATQEQ